MAKAKKLKSGSWRCLVYDYTDSNGKRHYESFTAETKKEAEYLAAEFAKNKDTKDRTLNLTFNDAVTRYIETKSGVLSPSTIRSYYSIQKNYFSEIGQINIRNLSNTDIQIWVSDLSKKVSPKTVRNAHGLLASTVEMFLPDFRLKTSLPQKENPNLYVPSDSDIEVLLNHIKGSELEIAVLLAAFGPMRRGEICALESTDINGNSVTVNKAMVLTPEKTWELKPPKTFSSNRTIEFPDFVIDRMQGIEGRIIKATPDQISNRFKRAVRFSKLPHFRFHDLRHYSASIMHAIGVPDQYIMQRGGWASDNVMKSVYRNVIDLESRKQNKKIIGHFEKMQHEMQHNGEKVK
ncbi:MAG: site-specific integrase [Lachnospiraceae bacterium]|nr:site-specific integrase [Lachnospiraceae bacterium]